MCTLLVFPDSEDDQTRTQDFLETQGISSLDSPVLNERRLICPGLPQSRAARINTALLAWADSTGTAVASRVDCGTTLE